ncbi:HpcH/HpaI aldolase/citrate lyase family protein [Iodobacter ciconiae]|uniref:ATP-binding protein n=1 Tax=Iodobacter ciconiae TaxID=2496266 RepID=A0A3S8ZTW1_9NEIS|nr:HpcH/HpaI aldolase/citrate lyase family protein [Iodobacter ciconiae]AZN36947.1 ATP-binding protein [Iodobacter ciconiae]
MAISKVMGASLYVPATHKDLQQIADGQLLGDLRSVIFCTEDAVAESELSYALFSLSLVLQQMVERPGTERFVRVRNPEVMKRVLEMPGVEKLTGFVLPKITHHNFDAYFQQVRKTQFMLMPTLETVEVFDDAEMKLLRQSLERPGVRDHIQALRIGGNDLLALLGIRRPRHVTIYKTPLGAVISKLVTIFRPYGFVLTAPVFEHLDNPALLAQEVEEDLAHGMVGKTAIHPGQVALIEQHYRVQHRDVDVAMKIIDESSPAVFRMHDSMCEVATHRAWAHSVLEQARVFGVHAMV